MSNPHANLTMDGGVKAWEELNHEIRKNRAAAKAWYGKNKRDFAKAITSQRPYYQMLSPWYWPSIIITKAFIIRREDWLLAIRECLPVCHTWYRSRIEEFGECSWLLIYRALKNRLGKKRVTINIMESYSLLVVVSVKPAACIDL